MNVVIAVAAVIGALVTGGLAMAAVGKQSEERHGRARVIFRQIAAGLSAIGAFLLGTLCWRYLWIHAIADMFQTPDSDSAVVAYVYRPGYWLFTGYVVAIAGLLWLVYRCVDRVENGPRQRQPRAVQLVGDVTVDPKVVEAVAKTVVKALRSEEKPSGTTEG